MISLLFLSGLSIIYTTKIPDAEIRSGYILKGEPRIYPKKFFTAEEYGRIKGSGFFPVLEKGPKCKEGFWYRIGTDAWICSGWFIPSRSNPGGNFNWSKGFNPGRYYKARQNRTEIYPTLGHLNAGKPRRLRLLRGFLPVETIFIGNFPWYRLFENGYVHSNAVEPWPVSANRSISVKNKELPLLFTSGKKEIPIYRKAGKNWKETGKIPTYSIRSVKTVINDWVLLKAPKDTWIKREDVNIAFKLPVFNPEVKPDENWIDVNLKENIVYAVKGQNVVRVFLVAASDETPIGTYRIYWKKVWKTFDRQRQKEAYFLETVPFILYFKESYAFHGAYWHDDFGRIKTHGCINLSIPDAKWLFNFASPNLPDGWFSLKSSNTTSGTLVRIRRN
ncbi:L,D-transpeptidase [Myxococcota bacterium]|nr:L,D-transpeptidase [Myxococcota bacterium]MBU1380694.1 L,D-transpeptidase [Myxococcota bacterium]MBU1495902.1 L,D-transpeptidase [Myxococcota bacterium]